MKTIFTKSSAKFGCYKENNEQDQFLPNEDFTISDVLNANVPLKDKAWFMCHNCEFTDRQLREFAISCALCVLPIYEEKYPDNKAPREAIEAAQGYLAGTIGLGELRIKRRAAYDAAYADDAAAYAVYAAAYAAYAAYAAANAAYAAYAAADYAAYAAYAAADYADTAVVRNSDVFYQEKLLQFFKNFVK